MGRNSPPGLDRSSMDGLIIIPVFNEEEALPGVIQELTQQFPREALLFVDDASSDRTPAILKHAHVQYLRHPVNLGYKEALLTGLAYSCRMPDYRDVRYCVFFDADGQHRVDDLIRLIQAFETGEADCIIGSRFQQQTQPEWSLRYLVNTLFSRVVSYLSGVHITDSTCGLKLISAKYVPCILNDPSEDLHAELLLSLVRRGARIQEIPITAPPRESGVSMYHMRKALLYPTKTAVCMLHNLFFRPA